jgi:predicted NBD/HSP70 family sugar kinase
MKTYAGKPQMIKKVNHNVVIEAIKSVSGISQPQIAEITGLSLATVNKIVKELEKSEKITCKGYSSFTGGRRAKVYELNLNRGFIVSIFIQDDTYHCMLANILGDKIESTVHKHDSNLSWSEEILMIIDKTMEPVDSSKVKIIGVAIPGTVTDGIIHNIPAIPEWEGICLEELLSQKYNCMLLVMNDMKSATMGVCEQYLAQGRKNMVFISVLNSIGSGIIINGQLYNSNRNYAGELSYLTFGNASNIKGKYGNVDSILQRAIQKNDKKEIIKLISNVLVNISCILDPDMVVISTPYMTTNDEAQIRELMSEFVLPQYIPEIAIDEIPVEWYLQGLVSICAGKVDTPIRLVKE